jgi:KaiC/GvpD/RAD55 family RecA-like ATPase
LCNIVAEFLGEGLNERQPALAIATPEHREGILAGLRARQFDVDSLQTSGDLLVIDGAELLASVMVDGMPDAALFTSAATSAIEAVCRGRKVTIRAYGEMIDMLWKSGQDAAAIRLELLWNKLATTNDFDLLCGYSMGTFYKGADLSAIQRDHSQVISPQGVFLPAPRPELY